MRCDAKGKSQVMKKWAASQRTSPAIHRTLDLSTYTVSGDVKHTE